MSCGEPDDPGWLKWLQLAGGLVAWLVLAVLMLACLFGCMLYNWEGN